MTTNIKAGSVVLAGQKGEEVALSWRAGDKERRRALPAGAYRLRTTRVERRKGDAHWFLSQAGPPGEPRTLAKGKTLRVEVDDTVVFKGMVRRPKGKWALGFSITGRNGRGLSVYRNDRRVPVTYRILSAKGKVLASGTMNYG